MGGGIREVGPQGGESDRCDGIWLVWREQEMSNLWRVVQVWGITESGLGAAIK